MDTSSIADPADVITFVAVCGLILIGLIQCVAVAAVLKAYDRAVRRAEIAERLLHYRRPPRAAEPLVGVSYRQLDDTLLDWRGEV